MLWLSGYEETHSSLPSGGPSGRKARDALLLSSLALGASASAFRGHTRDLSCPWLLPGVAGEPRVSFLCTLA